MICQVCQDKGLVRVGDPDALNDLPAIAACRCAYGRRMRESVDKAGTPRYRVWAAKHGIDIARVGVLEDHFRTDELATMGFVSAPVPDARPDNIAAIAKTRRPKL